MSLIRTRLRKKPIGIRYVVVAVVVVVVVVVAVVVEN